MLFSSAIFTLSALATGAQAWTVTTYYKSGDCLKGTHGTKEPADVTYRIFEGDESTLGVCQGIAGKATNSAITCTEERNGGADGPYDCADLGEHNFYGTSVWAEPTTDGDTKIFCEFYASPDCTNDDQSQQNVCFQPFGLGAVSFQCRAGY